MQQLQTIYQQAGVNNQNYLKFCPNITKIEKEKGTTPTTTPTIQTPTYQTTTPANSQFKAPIQSSPATDG